MNIGSNNSLSYLSPSTWWAKIFPFIGRCQTLDYEDQYKYYGVRLFDLRIWTEDHNIVIRNGSLFYKFNDIYKMFSFFDAKGDVTVRIRLDITVSERLTNDEYPKIQKRFADACERLEILFPNVNFIGGTRIYDDFKLYNFNYEKKYGTPNIIEVNESRWIYRALPILMALRNSKMMDKYEDEHGFLMLNYVERK